MRLEVQEAHPTVLPLGKIRCGEPGTLWTDRSLQTAHSTLGPMFKARRKDLMTMYNECLNSSRDLALLTTTKKSIYSYTL